MRLAGREKMGYYPTPGNVVDSIGTFLSFPAEPFTALDPCCGEGLALQRLTHNTEAKTYGVELDKHRADESRPRLDHILKCGIEETRIAHRSCSLLFLNPPYDETTLEEDAETKTERKEKAFLRATVPYLTPGGVLVYIIPQSRLDKSIAKMLAYRFEQISVYRFPDPEYSHFRQVVVFGVRKTRNSPDDEQAAILEGMRDKDLPPLPDAGTSRYSVPPSEPIKLFRSTIIDPEELEASIKKSPLWRRFHDAALGRELMIARPPLPLHSGHLGLLLAAGKLDGIVGSGSDLHVVKGKVAKVVSKVQEYKGDVLEERELDRYVVSIKILDRGGEIRELT